MKILRPALASAWRQARIPEVPLLGPILPCQGISSIGYSPIVRNLSATAEASSSPADVSSNAAANKQKVEDTLYSYILAHTREPPILTQLRAETLERFPQAAKMAVSPEQGAFLGWLIGALGVKRIIEVGVFTGYSSVAMALALPPDGRLIACDRDPKAMEMAQEYWRAAGIENKIEARLAPAIESLQALLDAGGADQYDFAFVDADKRKYRDYYEILLKLVRPGGTIAIDNVLWYGKVGDPEVTDKATVALRELNDFLMNDDRIDMSLVPIGDGVTLCRRLK